jgi:hypothetical protein
MKSSSWVALTAVLVAGGLWARGEPQPATAPVPPATASAPAGAEQTTTAEGSAPSLRQQCRGIAAIVNLSDEQWRRVEANLARLEKAKEAWQQTNEPRVRELADEIQQARTRGDVQRIRQIEPILAPLLTERAKVYDHDMDAIFSVLTPEQNVEFEAHGLFVTALRSCEKAGITPEQIPRVMALCREYAPLRLKADTWREKNRLRQELLDAVSRQVLTRDQRITRAAAELNESAYWYFKSAQTTVEQDEKIRQLCRRIGEQKLDARDWREEAYLRRVMLNRIYDDILTDEQRAKVNRPPLARPLTTAPASGPATSPADGPAGVAESAPGGAPDASSSAHD